MKNIFYFMSYMLIVACISFISCSNEAIVEVDELQNINATTRAYGDKTPKVVSYVEVNDVNPLNVGSYKLGASAMDPAFFDVAIIFAANIHYDTNRNPSLHFNDNVTQILNDVDKYIKPLQDMGIKVLLSILGDHQGIGVANLTSAQAKEFARILTYAVDTYGLDGIDFDDEYAKYGTNGFPNVNSTSYSNVINELRAKMVSKFPAEYKLITVFDWDYAYTLNSTAVSNLDYAWYGVFGPNSYGSSNISGMPNSKWSPQAINLNSTYLNLQLTQIQTRSGSAASNNMGAIMTYDIRPASSRNPLNALQRIGLGAFGSTVTYDGTEYSKDWVPGATYTITSAMLPSGY